MTPILASASAARRAMLTAAGVDVETIAAQVDEAEIKAALVQSGSGPRDIATALAETKALKVSARHPGRMVIGADQILADDQGRLFDKPVDSNAAAAQLRDLAGRSHVLHSVVVIAESGRAVWRATARATMGMRPLSEAFIADYLDREGDAVLASVGAYRIEGLGAQLFSRIEGDHFTILGLPLLPLLDYLRVRGVLPS